MVGEIGIPALRQGQVLVEIGYSGVCGTQLMEARGRKGPDRWLPHCMGHEASGVVLEAGPGVTKVKEGDAVVLSWLKGGGIDSGGAKYDWDGREVNAGPVTTFQRHALVSENRLTKLPAGVDPKTAVLLGCALLTGIGAVVNVARLMPGESVVVFGAGGVGQCAIAGAAVSGCAPIIAVDPNPARRELAKKLGATHTIDPAAVEAIDRILEIVPGGVTAAVEASGLPTVMEAATKSVRAQGGRVVIVGNAPVGSLLGTDPSFFNQGKSLLGTWGGDAQPDRDIPRYGALLAAGRLPVGDMLSAPYDLAGINDALDDLEAGKVGRPLVRLRKE